MNIKIVSIFIKAKSTCICDGMSDYSAFQGSSLALLDSGFFFFAKLLKSVYEKVYMKKKSTSLQTNGQAHERPVIAHFPSDWKWPTNGESKRDCSNILA